MLEKLANAEKQHIIRAQRFPDQVLMPDFTSVQEQFEYLRGPEFKIWLKRTGEKRHKALFSNGISGFIKLVRAFGRNIRGIVNNRRKNFEDVEEYLSTLEQTGKLPQVSDGLLGSFPNTELWADLKSYAWEKHRLLVGFTELPGQYIFAGKVVLFRYALVFIQEMRKEPIELAPRVDAGVEVITVYNSLGQATNDVADWLRKNHKVVCMANHPLGGIVDTTPLAEKAGLGAIGHSGLLITPEFGPRCRISPIFISDKLFEFTDNNKHDWVSAFCATCHRCEKSCPMDAILTEKKVTARYNGNFKDRTETIDRERCFLYFSRTMGCALCIKNCPFSKDPRDYQKRKEKLSRKPPSPEKVETTEEK